MWPTAIKIYLQWFPPHVAFMWKIWYYFYETEKLWRAHFPLGWSYFPFKHLFSPLLPSCFRSVFIPLWFCTQVATSFESLSCTRDFHMHSVKKEIFKGVMVAFQNSYKTYENVTFLTHLKPYYINRVYWFFSYLLLSLILSVLSLPSKQKKE